MIQAKVHGLAELKAALAGLKRSLQKQMLQKALLQGARVIRDDAKRNTPVLKAPIRRRGVVIRKPRTAQKAIVAARSRRLTRGDTVGVRVKVRPAKAGQQGARSPVDPFYVAFLERGTRKMRAFGMLRNAARTKLSDALQKIEQSLREQLAKFGR